MADCCTYCDKPFGEDWPRTKDHVVPRALKRFGGDEGGVGRRNKVFACVRCNLAKANLMPSGLRKKARKYEAEARRLEDHAALLYQIADRAEQIIKERKLL